MGLQTKHLHPLALVILLIFADLARVGSAAQQAVGRLTRLQRYQPKGVQSLLAGESMKLQQRQNFNIASEEALSAHARVELQASYTYRVIAAYFARSDVALGGFEEYFRKKSEDSLEKAQTFIDYMNSRGGIFIFQMLEAPRYDWTSATDAMKHSLAMELDISDSLLKVHRVCTEGGDPQFTDTLETFFMRRQVEHLKEIADLLTNIERVGHKGVGIYILDRALKQGGAEGAGANPNTGLQEAEAGGEAGAAEAGAAGAG